MLAGGSVDPLRTTTLPHPPGSAKNDQDGVLLPAGRSGSRPTEHAQLVSLPVVKALLVTPGPARLALPGRVPALRSGNKTHGSRAALQARYTAQPRKQLLSPGRTTHLHAHWPDSDRCDCRLVIVGRQPLIRFGPVPSPETSFQAEHSPCRRLPLPIYLQLGI